MDTEQSSVHLPVQGDNAWRQTLVLKVVKNNHFLIIMLHHMVRNQDSAVKLSSSGGHLYRITSLFEFPYLVRVDFCSVQVCGKSSLYTTAARSHSFLCCMKWSSSSSPNWRGRVPLALNIHEELSSRGHSGDAEKL